jgi:hypothetical protein
MYSSSINIYVVVENAIGSQSVIVTLNHEDHAKPLWCDRPKRDDLHSHVTYILGFTNRHMTTSYDMGRPFWWFTSNVPTSDGTPFYSTFYSNFYSTCKFSELPHDGLILFQKRVICLLHFPQPIHENTISWNNLNEVYLFPQKALLITLW